jgi:3-oxoacyl-[acyl-carrier-protein] synthase II
MRIWVTGVGLVTPLGRDAATTMERLLAGERAFAPLTLFSADGCRSAIAAEVPDLVPRAVAPAGDAERWSRTDAMAWLAAREALAQAGVEPGAVDVDLVVGGSTAGLFETEAQLVRMASHPTDAEPRARLHAHPLSSTADRLCETLGPFGRVRTLSSACSSGAHAVLLAAAWLGTGRAARVLAGAADGLCRLTYVGFSALGALGPEPCRPFDLRRAGLSLGEAAAFLVLETEDAARARGARPLAELRGWASASEAHHITNPEASGETAARVMRRALERAGVAPEDVGYVNAHGTGTRHNDAMEARAIARALAGARPAVSSSKGQIGHTLAAAGAVEAAVTALALARGRLPPTGGLERIDPDCDGLDHLRAARVARVRAAMSNSFGFGGSDTALVLAQPGELAPLAAPPPHRVFVRAAAALGPLGLSGAGACAAYLEPGCEPAGGRLRLEARAHLDAERARRLDRAACMATVVIDHALGAAGVDAETRAEAGAVVGSAFGAVEPCALYLRRVHERGARLAAPAAFPSLLPSAAVAHASIYLGLRGVALATADLGATAEAAVATAAELVAGGESACLAAGSAEEWSAIVEEVVGPLATGETPAVRTEGASALVLAAAPGAAPLAELVWWTSWRGAASAALGGAPSPRGRGRVAVVVGAETAMVARAIEAAGWAGVERLSTARRAGWYEGAGGLALAAAAALVGCGRLDAAFVVGAAPDRGAAWLLGRA